MANEIWQQEEQKFLHAIQDVKIPNETLDDVPCVTPKIITDLDIIPQSGGCYWIWTTEPVRHSLHKNPTPKPFDNGEVIYNGIAKDDVRSRVKHHLFGQTDAGWSGISLDIYFGNTISHRKKALSDRGKVPFVIQKKTIGKSSTKKNLKKGDEIEIHIPIRKKDDFLKIHLSDNEMQLLNESEVGKIYFRNGIDISEPKHAKYEFRVYFITGLSSLYLEFIEKKWRKSGLPKLCSYSSGR
jgi:hypothetical protein